MYCSDDRHQKQLCTVRTDMKMMKMPKSVTTDAVISGDAKMAGYHQGASTADSSSIWDDSHKRGSSGPDALEYPGMHTHSLMPRKGACEKEATVLQGVHRLLVSRRDRTVPLRHGKQ